MRGREALARTAREGEQEGSDRSGDEGECGHDTGCRSFDVVVGVELTPQRAADARDWGVAPKNRESHRTRTSFDPLVFTRCRTANSLASSPPEPWLPQESESDDHENEGEHERQVEQRHPHDRAGGVEGHGYRKGWGRP
jgi:hypothetical protein